MTYITPIPPKHATEFMSQVPRSTLDEICNRLWELKEFEHFRALVAYTKERDALLAQIKEYERGV